MKIVDVVIEEELHDWGTNPCSEIILRSCQFCNLSEVVVRPGDTLADLKRKVRLATILGTLQSTLTDFRYLRKIWSDNTKEERLLGVSLTGIMDHPTMSDSNNNGYILKRWLKELKDEAIKTLSEAIAEMLPGDTIEFETYGLLTKAPLPPEGIEQMIEILKKGTATETMARFKTARSARG